MMKIALKYSVKLREFVKFEFLNINTLKIKSILWKNKKLLKKAIISLLF